MKAETDPITTDEWLVRAVWKDRVTAEEPAISASSFAPRKDETTGISLYRRDCLNDPADILLPFAEEKRPLYALVQVPVSLLTELGLTVTADPRPDVAGHVLIPELNRDACRAHRLHYNALQKRLAVVASANILRRPTAPE